MNSGTVHILWLVGLMASLICPGQWTIWTLTMRSITHRVVLVRSARFMQTNASVDLLDLSVSLARLARISGTTHMQSANHARTSQAMLTTQVSLLQLLSVHMSVAMVWIQQMSTHSVWMPFKFRSITAVDCSAHLPSLHAF